MECTYCDYDNKNDAETCEQCGSPILIVEEVIQQIKDDEQAVLDETKELTAHPTPSMIYTNLFVLFVVCVIILSGVYSIATHNYLGISVIFAITAMSMINIVVHFFYKFQQKK